MRLNQWTFRARRGPDGSLNTVPERSRLAHLPRRHARHGRTKQSCQTPDSVSGAVRSKSQPPAVRPVCDSGSAVYSPAYGLSLITVANRYGTPTCRPEPSRPPAAIRPRLRAGRSAGSERGRHPVEQRFLLVGNAAKADQARESAGCVRDLAARIDDPPDSVRALLGR